ncbi:MAG: sigma-70 family RNA polymerase sigma factor [Verrucomicrobiota bacterium JB023]|nr:sigma-70 family RNA polymerase sigma factor [Verrucomicrobiota bacterium JB023]
MHNYLTRHTLLQRACDPRDEGAWEEFVGHYRRFIYYILHQVGIDSDDRDDVCQQILLILTRDLGSYDRSRSKFRTWLSTVIRNAAFTHLRSRKRYQIRIETLGRQVHFDDPGDGPSELDQVIEMEWANYVSSLAMERVRSVFQGQAIEVFEMSLDELPPDEIARRSNLTVSSVYTLRKRVKKRLYLEIRALTKELEP